MKRLANIIVIVGIVCSIAIIGIDQIYKNLDSNKSIIEVANKLAKYDKIYNIGDKVKVAKYEVQVHSTAYLDDTEDIGMKADKRYRFYKVDATVANNTDSPIEGSMLFATKLYVEGIFYDIEYTSPAAKKSLEQSILPGESLRGSIIFQIPEDSTDIKLIYMSTVWDYRIVIDLDKQIALEDKVS